MKVHELQSNKVKKSAKRVGRGISAGGGKTAGRGTKGQNSRAGHNIPRKFEGGQTPLVMRLHKLPGFKSPHAKAIVITLSEISKNYKNSEVVSLESLIAKGLIKKGQRAKILSTGELKVKVKIDGIPASKSALETIEKFSVKAEKVESAPQKPNAKTEPKDTTKSKK